MICYLPDIEGLLVYSIQGKTFKVVWNVEISFQWEKLMTYPKKKGKDPCMLGMVHAFCSQVLLGQFSYLFDE